MRVGVTGANGFVGRAVLAALTRGGHHPVALLRRADGAVDGVEAAAVGDLADVAAPLPPLPPLDAVIHLAALAAAPAGRSDAALAACRAVNVGGTARAVAIAGAAGAGQFVYLSSVKAIAERSAAGVALAVDAVPVPEDAYGTSKLEAEGVTRQHCGAAGMDWTIIRPPMVYGHGGGGNFALLARLARAPLPLPLGAIHNRRSILHVDVLADALVAAIGAPAAAGATWHVADAAAWSTPDLVTALAAVQGRRAWLVPVPAGLLRVAARLTGQTAKVGRLTESLLLDTSAITAAIGWAPPQEPDAGFRATLTADGREQM